MERMSTPRRAARPEQFDDFSFGIDVTRFPGLEPNHDFVADPRLTAIDRRRLHINVVNDSRIVRHDVEEIARLLQGSDDRLVRTRQNPNNATFRTRLACPRKFRAANDACHHAIAVQGGAGVFRRDKEIGLPRFLVRQKGVAGLVHAQRSGNEISCIGQDVSIFPNARDFALLFEIAQNAAHLVPSACVVTKRIGDFDFIQRPIFRFLNESQNLCAQIVIRCFPFACHEEATLRCSLLVFQPDLCWRLGFQPAEGRASARPDMQKHVPPMTLLRCNMQFSTA